MKNVVQDFFDGFISVRWHILFHELHEIFLKTRNRNVGNQVQDEERKRKQGHEKTKGDGRCPVSDGAFRYTYKINVAQIVQRQPVEPGQFDFLCRTGEVPDYRNLVNFSVFFFRHSDQAISTGNVKLIGFKTEVHVVDGMSQGSGRDVIHSAFGVFPDGGFIDVAR